MLPGVFAARRRGRRVDGRCAGRDRFLCGGAAGGFGDAGVWKARTVKMQRGSAVAVVTEDTFLCHSHLFKARGAPLSLAALRAFEDSLSSSRRASGLLSLFSRSPGLIAHRHQSKSPFRRRC